MAAYANPDADALPSIHRPRAREVWKLDDTALDGVPGSSRQLYDLHEQLRSQREELRQRDEYIRELTCGDNRGWSVRDHAHCGIAACPSARSELAAMQAKVDNLHAKLRDQQLELEAAGEANGRLRAEVDRLKEDNARHLALNAELSRQVDCCEASRGSFEAAQSRSGHAVTSLQEQNRAAQERIRDLETRLRACLDEGERGGGERSGFEKRHAEFVNGLIYRLGCDCAADNLDAVSRKVSELVQETSRTAARCRTLQEQADAHEAEARANRETIQRLLAELSREQRGAQQQAAASAELEKLRAEAADAVEQRQHAEARLESRQRVLEATQAELREKDEQLARLQAESGDSAGRAEDAERQLTALLESLASALGSAYSHVTPTEEGVKEKVRCLCRDLKEQSEATAALEERTRAVNKQLEAQFEQNREKEQQSRRLEVEFGDMRDRLSAMEGELAASDVIRDGLRGDVQKFYKYMQQLAEAMKMDEVGADIGFDMLGDALLARAQQLARLSDDATHDKTSAIYSLQRKVKTLKEQLESRDLHMDLLRKKMAQLEERANGRMDAERERDTETGRVRRLQKQLEKSQQQMEAARAEIVGLKAQLLEASNLKLACIEQDRELQSLGSSLEKLERVRQKQAKKIAELRSESDSKEKEQQQRSSAAEDTVSSLSSELRTTKQALEDAKRRERQLLELRAVVARMLGLDVESLAVPDYEVVNRLERLVQAHQSNVYTAFAAERAVQDMESSFQEGVADAQMAALQQRRSRSPCPACRLGSCGCRREQTAERTVGWAARTRSVSPARDTRKY